MATENDQNNAPDSWDNDIGDDQISKSLKSLNVNAPSFIPGQNPYASSFEPSGPSLGQKEEETGNVLLIFDELIRVRYRLQRLRSHKPIICSR